MTTGVLWPGLIPAPLWDDDELCIRASSGTRVTTLDGTELIDADSGLWNVNLGYGDEVIAEAVARAVRDNSYASVFRASNPEARHAAGLLVDLAGIPGASVVFSTSGGAANDVAMKIARHYQVAEGRPRRRGIVSLAGSYHGLTFGAFALTGEDLGQELYGVDRRAVHQVPANDVDALERFVRRAGAALAAVVVEPVLGTGTVVLDPAYVERLVALRAEHGFLLVADEVATGFGRTGPMLASRAWPEPPDVVILSKGLTNGTLAASALVVAPHVVAAFRRDDAILVHGETQAGTAVTAAAIAATVERFAALGALDSGRRVGDRVAAGLAELVAGEPAALATTGAGCFRTLTLAGPGGGPIPQAEVATIVRRVRREGVVVHPGPGGIQLAPALTMTDDEVDLVLAAVRRVVRGLAPSPREES